MSTNKIFTVISGIEYQLNILKGKLNNLNEETKRSVDEAYQRGLDDAWEAARKIVLNPDEGGISTRNLSAIFGLGTMQYAFTKNSASEAIAKLKAYEEKQAEDEIKAGDEVKLRAHKENYLVTSYKQDGDMCNLMDVRGGFFRVKKCDIHKTGRHFDIEKILEEMASMSIN